MHLQRFWICVSIETIQLCIKSGGHIEPARNNHYSTNFTSKIKKLFMQNECRILDLETTQGKSVSRCHKLTETRAYFWDKTSNWKTNLQQNFIYEQRIKVQVQQQKSQSTMQNKFHIWTVLGFTNHYNIPNQLC